MRWIVVFLFLYFIPLIVLFKNYNNIKRSFIYASMYITLVTTIVITNIYISGLNKIKESMYYQNYSFGKEYTEAFAEQLKELLSPLENHVLYLHLMGTDYRTIAELLGKSPKSVDNALQRIKTKAQKILP